MCTYLNPIEDYSRDGENSQNIPNASHLRKIRLYGFLVGLENTVMYLFLIKKYIKICK